MDNEQVLSLIDELRKRDVEYFEHGALKIVLRSVPEDPVPQLFSDPEDEEDEEDLLFYSSEPGRK